MVIAGNFHLNIEKVQLNIEKFQLNNEKFQLNIEKFYLNIENFFHKFIIGSVIYCRNISLN